MQRLEIAHQMVKKVGLKAQKNATSGSFPVVNVSGWDCPRVGGNLTVITDEPFARWTPSPATRCKPAAETLAGDGAGAVDYPRYRRSGVLATELVLFTRPRPRVGAAAAQLARRFVAGESSRSIKSDPLLIAMREYVLSRVFEQREAFASVLINEKLHSHRLKWRWPLSRQVTLSIGTLAILLTVWWVVAALQLISPLFLPPPQQVLANCSPLPGRRDLWTPRCGSICSQPDAHFAGATRGGVDRYSGQDRQGYSDGARHSGSDNRRLYRPVPPLYLPLMVIWFGIGETSKILLIYLAIFCAGGDVGAGGVKARSRFAFVPPSRWVPAVRRCWVCHLPGALPESSPDYALVWCGLVYAGGGGIDCRNARFRIYGSSQRVNFSRD